MLSTIITTAQHSTLHNSTLIHRYLQSKYLVLRVQYETAVKNIYLSLRLAAFYCYVNVDRGLSKAIIYFVPGRI